jgi:hypothetical protein
MRMSLALALGTALALWAPVAHAEAVINGFRSARFGMSEADVRAAIGTDFPGSAMAITAQDAQDNAPRLLSVPLIRLNPGPVPAVIAYGFRDGRLAQIDVTWAAPGEPSAAQRAGLLRAGERLRRHFEGQADKPARIVPAGVLGPNSLLLHGAADRLGARVEALVEGISFERMVDGKPVMSPEPTGPAVLRVSYRAGSQQANKQAAK